MPEALSLLTALVSIVCGVLIVRKVSEMSTELDTLIANEAALEAVVAQVVADNATLHTELTAALASADVAGIQAVADKIAAQTSKLSALVNPPPAAPAAPTA